MSDPEQAKALSESTTTCLEDFIYDDPKCHGTLIAKKSGDKWLVEGALSTRNGDNIEYRFFSPTKELADSAINQLMKIHIEKWWNTK